MTYTEIREWVVCKHSISSRRLEHPGTAVSLEVLEPLHVCSGDDPSMAALEHTGQREETDTVPHPRAPSGPRQRSSTGAPDGMS